MPGDRVHDQHANDYVFVLAFHQAREWVRVVARHDPTPQHAMKAFTASLGTSISETFSEVTTTRPKRRKPLIAQGLQRERATGVEPATSSLGS